MCARVSPPSWRRQQRSAIPKRRSARISTSLRRQDNPSLGWSVVTLPQSAKGAERALTHSSAVQALERVELPANVSARISELLWTGGSLIISDQALSNETSEIGTDLVVTVR